MDIQDDSVVFCADQSVDKLKRLKFKNACSKWDRNKIKMYNFFTSRFYNALDIELDEQPNIIIISDVYFAEQTMVDPYCDVIQIVGRFRNGVSNIVHISNTNKDLPQRSMEEIKTFIFIAVRKFIRFLPAITIRLPPKRQGMHTVRHVIVYHIIKYLDKKQNKNWFAIDNYINEEILKRLLS